MIARCRADDELLRVWRAYTDVASRFFAAGPTGARLVGPGWFAALANEPSGELNVCGLTPEATVTSAQALVSSIATELPLIVFVSERADPDAGAFLEANGFDTVTVPEPLMHATRPPTPVDTALRIEPAAGAAALAAGIELTSEANTVDTELLERSILHAADSGAAQMWLAWDGSRADQRRVDRPPRGRARGDGDDDPGAPPASRRRAGAAHTRARSGVAR